MEIIEKFRKLAQSKKRTIVLPEGEEERVIQAAAFLKKNNLVTPILLGDPDKISKLGTSLKQISRAYKSLIRPNPNNIPSMPTVIINCASIKMLHPIRLKIS